MARDCDPSTESSSVRRRAALAVDGRTKAVWTSGLGPMPMGSERSGGSGRAAANFEESGGRTSVQNQTIPQRHGSSTNDGENRRTHLGGSRKMGSGVPGKGTRRRHPTIARRAGIHIRSNGRDRGNQGKSGSKRAETNAVGETETDCRRRGAIALENTPQRADRTPGHQAYTTREDGHMVQWGVSNRKIEWRLSMDFKQKGTKLFSKTDYSENDRNKTIKTDVASVGVHGEEGLQSLLLPIPSERAGSAESIILQRGNTGILRIRSGSDGQPAVAGPNRTLQSHDDPKKADTMGIPRVGICRRSARIRHNSGSSVSRRACGNRDGAPPGSAPLLAQVRMETVKDHRVPGHRVLDWYRMDTCTGRQITRGQSNGEAGNPRPRSGRVDYNTTQNAREGDDRGTNAGGAAPGVAIECNANRGDTRPTQVGAGLRCEHKVDRGESGAITVCQRIAGSRKLGVDDDRSAETRSCYRRERVWLWRPHHRWAGARVPRIFSRDRQKGAPQRAGVVGGRKGVQEFRTGDGNKRAARAANSHRAWGRQYDRTEGRKSGKESISPLGSTCETMGRMGRDQVDSDTAAICGGQDDGTRTPSGRAITQENALARLEDKNEISESHYTSITTHTQTRSVRGYVLRSSDGGVAATRGEIGTGSDRINIMGRRFPVAMEPGDGEAAAQRHTVDFSTPGVLGSSDASSADNGSWDDCSDHFTRERSRGDGVAQSKAIGAAPDSAPAIKENIGAARRSTKPATTTDAEWPLVRSSYITAMRARRGITKPEEWRGAFSDGGAYYYDAPAERFLREAARRKKPPIEWTEIDIANWVSDEYKPGPSRAKAITAIKRTLELAHGKSLDIHGSQDVQVAIKHRAPRACRPGVVQDARPLGRYIDKQAGTLERLKRLPTKELRDIAFVALRMETGFRGSDAARVPWYRFTRCPEDSSLSECEWYEVSTYDSKEGRLSRQRAPVWSQPVRVNQQSNSWATFSSIYDELERRTIGSNGGAKPPMFKLGGRQVHHRYFFHRISTTRKLRSGAAAIRITELGLAASTPRFMQERVLHAAEASAGLQPGDLGKPKELRHMVATYVYRLGVVPGRFSDDKLTKLLRHKHTTTKMNAYVRTGISSGAVGRIENDPQFQSMNWELSIGTTVNCALFSVAVSDV